MSGLELPLAFNLVFGAALGGALGSFLGCAAYRLPRRLPLSGRSHCPACGVQLRAAWMIPVVSWLAFRGRARCCGERLSAGYLFWESAAIIAAAAAAAVFGAPWVLLGVIVLAFCLAVAASVRTRGDG